MRSILSFYATRAMLIGAILMVAISTIYGFSHSNFVSNREIRMSPRTAVSLGLLSETEAPWSARLVFKKNDDGGYDYRDGGGLSVFTRTRTTDLDVRAECERIGGCEIWIPRR